MKICLLFILSLWFALPGFAQVFKGVVSNVNGDPVPYASLYLHELQSGFITDDDGCFQTTLKSGNYTCEVSSLGFTKQRIRIEVLPEGLTQQIVLAEQTYRLDEVSVTNQGEDPAYGIMRQAIAHAPYHRTEVKAYTASTYLKGTGSVNEIPAIFQLSKEVRKKSKEMLGKLFVMEDQRDVSFRAPATWSSRVKAYSSSFPEEIDVSIDLATINFYAPTLFDKVSPLSVGAFSYYRFRLAGCYVEEGRIVNKIQLLPKKNNPKLLSGYLYVIEDLWSVSAAELSTDANGLRMAMQVTCQEVKPSVYLPISISVKCNINMMGIEGVTSYLSAIHYKTVEVVAHHGNGFVGQPQANRVVTKSIQAPSKRQQKLAKQIEKLSTKEELTIRDAYQLSKLVSRAMEEKDTLRSKHKFERVAVATNSSVKVDSLANKKDSLYWATVRSVPLRMEELESYRRKELQTHSKDSLRKLRKSPTTGSSIEIASDNSPLSTLLFGRTFRTENKKAWVRLHNLSSYMPDYNFVDGLWLGAKLSAGVKLSDSSSLRFTPSVYYTTARQSVVGSGELTFDYLPRRMGQFRLEGGLLSADYNGESGESRFINGVASLLFARNDLKLYEKRFLTVSNQVELTNGLLFAAQLSWQQRQMLNNHVSQSLFGKQAETNNPCNDAFEPMATNELLKASFALRYTPAHYYRMVRGKKVYEEPRFPTFTLNYERAFPLIGAVSSPSYHRMELSASQQVEFGLFNTLIWSVNGGSFWGKNQMQFPDYKQFAATTFPVTERQFDDGFFLLNSYAYATTNSWAQAALTWRTPYLLLKQLPFLKKRAFDEALHIRTLLLHGEAPYTEVGYSVGLSHYARIAVFAGFERVNFRSVGVSLSLPLSRFTHRP